MIKREFYLSQIRPFYDSDLIKVITGVRRCGKSVILNAIKDEIAERSDNVIYLNFEELEVSERISSPIDLVEYVKLNRKKSKCYVFLDEIQVLDKWQMALKDLRLRDASIFITGSNSKLLSSEFMTYLSGREVSFRVRPFVYKELLEYSKELGKTVTPLDYLIFGGFPARIEQQGEKETTRYLNELKETIVIKDLLLRHKVKKDVLFRKIVDYVMKSNSRIFSSKSIYDYMRNERFNCSINTIIKYIDYLKQAYLIESIDQYSVKAKRELLYYSKIYLCDVGFNSVLKPDGAYDLEHNLENIVYNELVFMGYELTTCRINEKEIDFRAVKDGKTYYIQVAYMAAHPATYEREFSPFKTIDNNNQKILISLDPIDLSTSVVRHIKFEDFLLLDSL